MTQIRSYQLEAKKAVENALKKGINKQLLVMPTGTGKTFTACNAVLQDYDKVLWITHRKELIDQSGTSLALSLYSDVQEMAKAIDECGGFTEAIKWVSNNHVMHPLRFLKESFGIVKQEFNMYDKDIVVASVQTLYRRLDLIPKDSFDCIIVDEAHLFMADTFQACIDHFDAKLYLGLTATPTRMDGKSLYSFFNEIVFEYDLREAILDGWLVEIDAIRCKTEVNLDKVHTLAGDFNQGELTKAVDIPERNNLIVDKYEEYGNERQAIFYCVDIQHAVNLRNVFRNRGYDCEAVVSDTYITPDRDKTIRRFKKGTLRIITNVDILTTGFDYPNLSIVGTCCPTKSLVKYLQTIGRGTRPIASELKGIENAEERRKAIKNSIKPVLTLLDFVDVTSKHHIVNSWELDKKLPLEQRVFMTSEAKEEMKEKIRRERNVEAIHKKDLRVDLLDLPSYRVSKAARMNEPATSKQIALIAKLGYDIARTKYTKADAAVIIASNEISQFQLTQLRQWGYRADETSTYGEYVEVIKARKKKAVVMRKEGERMIGRLKVNSINEEEGPAF
jgi:superfamily II DNA or RNA helicase